MRYFIISLTFSLCLAFSKGIISGNIIDKTNQLPLEGTNISLVGTDLGVISDKDGNFSISELENGYYSISISYIGYETMVISDIWVRDKAYEFLKVGGYFAIITFHSLEDRIVKRFFNQVSKTNNPLSELKKFGGVSTPFFQKINKKPIIASEQEKKINPRSRSAKLRVVRKLSNKALFIDLKKLGLPQVADSLREFQCA